MFEYFQKNKKNKLAHVGRLPSTVYRLPSAVYCLFALVLPLSLGLATWVMWLTLVAALFTVYRSPSAIYRPPSTVLMVILFFLHVIALTYTSNVQAGVSELLFKSPLLIFPLVMWLSPPSKETLRRVLMCFIIGCLLTSLVCFVRSLINYHRITFCRIHDSDVGSAVGERYVFYAVGWCVFDVDASAQNAFKRRICGDCICVGALEINGFFLRDTYTHEQDYRQTTQGL